MSKREYSLDLLKFLSIVLIIFHHYQQTFNIFFEKGINFYNGEFYFGYIVELFFILSGIFTYKNIEIIKNIKFSSFFLKKYLRFLPLIFISGLVYLFLEVFYVKLTGTNFTYSFFTTVTSLFGVSRCFSERIMINNPVWYISVLLLCYILFFLVTKFAEKYNINKMFLYICVMIGSFILRFFLIKNMISLPLLSDHIMRGYTTFFYGIIIAKLLKNKNIKNNKFTFIISIFVCLLVVIFFKYISHVIYLPLIFIIYPCLIVVFQHSLLDKIFNKKMFSKLCTGVCFGQPDDFPKA